MKIKYTTLRLIVYAWLLSAGSLAFGQVTQIWDGHLDGTNVDLATNYVGNTLPNAGNGDTAEFNGLLAGNLLLNYVGNWQSGPGASGVILYLTGSQTGSVTIDTLNGNGNPPNFAIQNIQIDPGAGAFQIGSDTHRLNYAGRPSGAIHSLINNSSNTAKIGSMFHMIAGGGSPFTFDFSGTGNWQVNTFLVTDNTPANNTTVQVDGPGTVTWSPATPSSVGTANSIAAVNINGGLLILTTNHPKLGNQPFVINGAFQFNAPQQPAPESLSGVISGSGILQVSAGTLALSGASTFSGTNLLSGGELIANRAENPGVSGPLGLGSTISFQGGTLGFSINNTFDYSARFDISANQAFTIDTAGQNVTFSNALVSAGGTFTKLSPGTLTFAGTNTYTGTTTVSAGKLEIQGGMGSGNIDVGNSATLGVTEAGPQITPAALTVGTSSSATLEFNNVSSTATPPIAAGSVSAPAGNPIVINVASGSFLAGQSYPLFSWSSGSAPAVTLGVLTGAAGTLSTNGNTIVLNVSGLAYVWTGLNNGDWDTLTANNWKVNGVSQIFANGGAALFDDTATGATNIVLNSPVSPASTTVNSSSHIYNIASSGANLIGGSGGLLKNGNSILTLSGGVNNYTGVTTVSGGTISVSALANGGSASDIGAADNSAGNLVLNGGTLQYTGSAASVDRLFTLGTAGGTIDNEGGMLALNNSGTVALSGTGARTLILTGSDTTGDTLAGSIGDNGGATALNKTGVGMWVLAGNNTYTGLTTIGNGVLQVGVGGANGSIGTGNIDDNAGLDFNHSSTLSIPGIINGTGTLTNDGTGTLILTGNNGYSGGTVINSGTIQFGNGGASGSPNSGSQIIDNGSLIFDNTSLVTITGFGANISGTGNLIIRAGTVKTVGVDSYTGWTEIDPGATFQPSDGNAGLMSMFNSPGSIITNNGTIFMTRQDTGFFGISNNIVGTGLVWVDTGNQNSGLVVLAGTNTYSGGTFIGGSGIVLGDGMTPGLGSIVGTVTFTNTTGPTTGTFSQNKRLVFNRPDNIIFTNPIVSHVSDGSTVANSGSIEQMGPGTVTLDGSDSFPGGATIDAGMILQVGNGDTNGSVGTGSVSDAGTLIFDHSDNVTVPGAISDGTGPGSFIQIGAGTVTLSASNSYTGPTIVSNGTLVVSGGYIGGDLDVEGGSIAPAAAGTVGTLNIVGNMTIDSGSVLVTLNKSLAQSNSLFVLTNLNTDTAGILTANGGSLVLNNVGPGLTVGDTFVVFSEPVTGGNTIPIVLAGYTFNNNLAVDGSITVATVPVSVPPKFNNITLSGTNVVITATNNSGPFGSYHLLGTNNLKAPVSTWPVVSTGNFDSNGNVSLTNAVGTNAEFFILRVP